MEKPHAGLDDWLRMLQACFRKRMSGIRVDDITQYMCDPLRKCLRDEDPYVRKTAAISVAKLYDISPQLVEEHGFIDLLQDLFSDSNPMVVSNAVAALSDISEASANGRPVLDVGPSSINKMLTALNECSEWGQESVQQPHFGSRFAFGLRL